MRNFLNRIFFIPFLLFVSFTASSQCTSNISTYSPDSIYVFDSIPSNYYEITAKKNVKLLRTKEHWTDDLFITVFSDSSWKIWEAEGLIYDPIDFEFNVMKVAGIEDSVIHVQWTDRDMGSGMGSIYHKRLLWSMTGSTCYLNFIDKCTFVLKDKYGDNATYKTFYTHYYCKATISRHGVRFTVNNTCSNKFANYEGPEETSYDYVAKYTVGFYYFKNGKWNLRNTH